MAGTATIGWSTKNLSISFTTNSNSTTSGDNVVNNLTGVAAGALLVVTTATPDQSTDVPNGSVASSPSLTWTKQVESKSDGSGNTEIWTATFAAGGDITVTTTWATAAAGMSAVVYAMSNTEASPSGAENSAVDQVRPDLTITTTKPESYVVGVTSDWGAIDGVNRLYYDGITEAFYQFRSGIYTTYHYYRYVPIIDTVRLGLWGPSGMNLAGTSILEIRGI